jgi:hypothetical protein
MILCKISLISWMLGLQAAASELSSCHVKIAAPECCVSCCCAPPPVTSYAYSNLVISCATSDDAARLIAANAVVASSRLRQLSLKANVALVARTPAPGACPAKPAR